MTPETLALRGLIDTRCDEFDALLARCGATRPPLFGSVACGTAHERSEIDLFPEQLLKPPISPSVAKEAVAL